jgi:CubicO group peptidase (beta-lactamase class C family)
MTSSTMKPKVKIVVLTNHVGELSGNIKSQIEKISQQEMVEIAYVKEVVPEEKAAESEETARLIKNEKPSIVLIDKNIISPAWKIIDLIPREDNIRFYLDGDVTQIVRREIGSTKFSGAVKIIKAGEEKPIFRGAFGVSNKSDGALNTTETQFNIASNAKLFAAVGIAKLAEDKKITSDDKLEKWLPKDFPRRDKLKDITVRELLTHTSGLNGQGGTPSSHKAENKFDPDFLNARSIKDIILPMLKNEDAKDFFADSPQKNYQYANINYLLIGAVIEAVINLGKNPGDPGWKSYYDFIQENILTPAGMTHTVPTRSDSSTFPVNYAPPMLPMTQVIFREDLQHIKLKVIATEANHLAEKLQRTMDTLLNNYEMGLKNIKNKSDFNNFKLEFSKSIKETLKMFDDLSHIVTGLRDQVNAFPKEDLTSPDDESVRDATNLLLLNMSENLKDPQYVGARALLNSLVTDLSMASSAGFYRSTIDDMQAFQKALWSERKILNNPEKLVQNPVAINEYSHYGYAVKIFSKGTAMESQGHDGWAAGARSTVMRFPGPDIIIVSLANNEHPDTAGLTGNIVPHLVLSCMPEAKSNIRYFDPRINPKTSELLLSDIKRLPTTASNDEAEMAMRPGTTPTSKSSSNSSKDDTRKKSEISLNSSTAKILTIAAMEKSELSRPKSETVTEKPAVLNSNETPSLLTPSASRYPLAMQNNMSVTTKMGRTIDDTQETPKGIPPAFRKRNG